MSWFKRFFNLNVNEWWKAPEPIEEKDVTCTIDEEDVDCLVILTDWEEFKNLDLTKLKNKMKRPLIYDFRNIFDPVRMTKLGFEYFSVGRG